MKYLMPKFTCPASQHTNQLTWDLAFMSATEFQQKYQRTQDQIIERLETYYLDASGRWQPRRSHGGSN